MRVFLSKRGDKPLLLSLDSGNKAEALILLEMANTVPVLVICASGSEIEGRVRIQYKAADISIRNIVPRVIELEMPHPGTLCKTCAEYDKCDMRDACEHCGGYKKK